MNKIEADYLFSIVLLSFCVRDGKGALWPPEKNQAFKLGF